MLSSSIYTVHAGEEPVWLDSVPHFGYVVATKPGLPIPPDEVHDFERDVIHCAPGTEPPENIVTLVVKGHETPWDPMSVAAAWPTGHLYVMEAVYLNGEGERVRCRMIEVPEGVTPIETQLIPHAWAGDGS